MAAAAYTQIATDLRRKITARDIKPGGQLPTELELRGEYQASRNTVLDAIKILKDEGLVETRPGQGWFAKVRIVPFVNSIDWEDGTAIMEAQGRGRKAQATPPIVSRRPATPDMAERLQVPVGTEMVVRRQEWFLDDLPWKLQAVWCPIALSYEGAPRLLVAEDLREGVGNHLYSVLGLQPVGATVYFLPRRPSQDEARFFGFTDEGKMPYIIELIRTSSVVGESGPRPLYATVGVYAGDRNRFESFRPAQPGAQRDPRYSDQPDRPSGLGHSTLGYSPGGPCMTP
jgi:GntR family transcriptional regulator